jgi:kynurenine formamidase
MATLACLALCGCAAPKAPTTTDAFASLAQGADIVDLTHTLDQDFPFIPVPGVTFGFALEPIATLEKMGVAANAWRIHEHIGTQIDAPSHFSAGGHSMEALAAQALVVPVVVIDFRRESALDRDAVIRPEHIRQWERAHGRIPAGAVVALCTGWDRKIRDASFIGLDEQHVKHFPGFGPEAVRFLVRERDVWGVAVDTISFDVGIDSTYAAHRELLGAGKWALEALKGLDQLPPRGATLFIGAPKVKGATGGPARVIAFVPKAAAKPGSLRRQ